MNRPVDARHMDVSADHFAEDIRTLAAAAAFRPDFPPSLVRRIVNHRMVAGCPLAQIAASYAEADAALAYRSRA